MQIEPFGFEMDNWRAGMIAAAVCNTLIRTKGKPKGKALQPADFYPPVKGVRRSQLTPAQQEFIARRRRGNSSNSNS